jgi:hypothetical protein
MPTGHYQNKKRSVVQLFEERVMRTDGCWLWTGSINVGGYGVVTVGGRSGKKLYGHRIAYELFVGPVPDGMELDHLCRNRKCVRPDHLEAVTRQVNVVRGIGPSMLGAINGAKTHCIRGHEFDEINTRIRPSGGRTCRACEKLRRVED